MKRVLWTLIAVASLAGAASQVADPRGTMENRIRALFNDSQPRRFDVAYGSDDSLRFTAEKPDNSIWIVVSDDLSRMYICANPGGDCGCAAVTEEDPLWQAWVDTFSVPNNETDPIYSGWRADTIGTTFRFDPTNGRFGIGGTPVTKLHVINGKILASSSAYIRSSSYSDTTGGATMQGVSDVDNSYTRAWFGNNAHWNPTNNLWVVNNIGANDATGWLIPNGGGIKLIVKTTTGASQRTFTHANFLTGTVIDVANTGIVTLYNDLLLSEGGGATDFRNGVTSGTVLWTTPPDDGDANDVLKTDGAGVLRWEAESDPVFVAWVNHTPQAPANLTLAEIVSPTDGTKTAVSVSWDANAATDSVQGYQYEVRLASTSSTFDDGSVSGISFVFPSVMISKDSTYAFRVRAVGQRVAGSWCSWDSLTITGDVTPPSAPSSPAATANNAWSNTVEWTPPTDADLAWIEVLESPDSDTLNGAIIARVAQPGDYAVVAYVGSGSTQRWYWVRAVDDVGNHSVPWTAAGSPTTAAAQTVDIGDSQITTDKVNDGAITNAKVASIDAGKITAGLISAGIIDADSITTGTLSADRIAANSLTLGKISDDGALAALDTAGVAQLGATVIEGGKIKTGLLDADSIQTGKITSGVLVADSIKAGILTGRQVQTASSGQRAVMDSSDNTFKLYDSSGNVIVKLDDHLLTAGSVGGVILEQAGLYKTVDSGNDQVTEVFPSKIENRNDAAHATGSAKTKYIIMSYANGVAMVLPSGFGTTNLLKSTVNSIVQFSLNANGTLTSLSSADFRDGVSADSTYHMGKGLTFDSIPTYDNGGVPNPPSDANCIAAYPAAANGFYGPVKDVNDSKIYMVLKRGSGDWVYWAGTSCP